jgi:hypothetical protein
LSPHFTPKFQAAWKRIQSSFRKSGDGLALKLEFRDEMLKLGHEERIRNLYRVKDKLTGSAVWFVPNASQEEFLSSKTGRDVILKCRQVGFTTLMAIREYDKALWEENQAWGIMAHKQEAVKKIFDKTIKFTHLWFEKDWGTYYQPEVKSDNATTLSFDHDGMPEPHRRVLNSRVSVAFEFRSDTLNGGLHVSEAHFITPDRLAGSLQSVPATGEVIYESTPNGRGGDFYDQWQNWKRLRAQAPFRGHFVPWFNVYPEDPNDSRWKLSTGERLSDVEKELVEKYGLEERHIAWRRWCIAANCQGDVEVFNREYPTDDDSCFYSGEAQVFPASITQPQSKFCREPVDVGFLYSDGGARPKFEKDRAGFLTIWEHPDPQCTYTIGADPSQGVGKDRGAAFVLCQQTGKYVARMWGQLNPEDFANELYKLGIYFNRAWICPESNNHGHVVITVLKQRHYPNLYKKRGLDAVTGDQQDVLGFQTTGESKIVLTERFKGACKSGAVQILDEELIKEMTTFIQVSSKTGRSVRREAAPGCHDDLVIAASLAWEQSLARPAMGLATEVLVSQPPGEFVEYDSTGFPIYSAQ